MQQIVYQGINLVQQMQAFSIGCLLRYDLENCASTKVFRSCPGLDEIACPCNATALPYITQKPKLYLSTAGCPQILFFTL